MEGVQGEQEFELKQAAHDDGFVAGLDLGSTSNTRNFYPQVFRQYSTDLQGGSPRA